MIRFRAPRCERLRASGALGRLLPLGLGLGLIQASACGDKSLEQRQAEDDERVARQFGHMDPEDRPRTEAAKIEQLIAKVRDSGHTFVRNGQEHSSVEAAEHLTLKLERAGDRVHTAEEFVAHVASRSSITGQPYRLVTTEGENYVTRDWLLAQLREIERPPPPQTQATPSPQEAPSEPPSPPVVITIDADFALQLIEDSALTFLAPRVDDQPVVYTAGEFARMLRRKTQWLGPDIGELEPWLEEIATRSFKTGLPYQVQVDADHVIDVRRWLDGELAKARDRTRGEG